MPKDFIKRLVNLPKNNSFFLFGPRQTGKSTLLKQRFDPKTTLYIDLLDPEEYYKYSTDISSFSREINSLKSEVTHVIIDEIQRIPELLNQVHILLEKNKNRFFILTGSSARKLKRGQANLLGGRAWNFNLYPLVTREMGVDCNLDKLLQYGSLPQVFLMEEELDIHRSLAAYADIYIQEEIKAESLVRNIGAFMMFLRFAADANGSIINFTNISKEINVSNVTVKEYFQILEDTLLGFFLMPYADSARKQLVKHPKFYFFDLGVVRQLNGKIKATLSRSTKDYGNAFEHFIIKEVVHLSKYLENDYRFNFYRTSSGAEVDLIITKPSGEVLAVEIKSGTNINLKDLKGLISFKELKKDAQLICVSQVKRDQTLETKSGDTIVIKAWEDFLREFFL